MFWAGIIGNELVGPCRVPEGVKLNSRSYINFLDDYLSQWLDDLPLLQIPKNDFPCSETKFFFMSLIPKQGVNM